MIVDTYYTELYEDEEQEYTIKFKDDTTAWWCEEELELIESFDLEKFILDKIKEVKYNKSIKIKGK